MDLNGRVISFLDKLCPNGLMNMRPNYSIRNMHVKGAPKVLGSGGGHHKFSVKKTAGLIRWLHLIYLNVMKN